MLAAGADDRLRRLVVEAVLALEFLGDRFAQRRDAGNRRIFRLAALDRFDRGLLDIVRRVEIGLAGLKRNDIPPRVLEIARLLRGRDGRGGFYAQKGIGDERHGARLRYGKQGNRQQRRKGERPAPNPARTLGFKALEGNRKNPPPLRRSPCSPGDAADTD